MTNTPKNTWWMRVAGLAAVAVGVYLVVFRS